MYYVNTSTTMKDNIDRLLEALDTPKRLSDETLNDLLDDAEIRNLHAVVCRTASAIFETSEPDPDAEWEAFSANHSKPKRAAALPFFTCLTRRTAAAIMGGVSVSLIALAATIAVRHTLPTDAPQLESQAALTVDSVASTAVLQPATEPEIIVFRKQPLDSILSAVAVYHGAAVDFRNVSKKELFLYYRWDQSLSLDETVAQLNNFERINLTLSDKVIIVE